jgi:hypothetical protein
MSSRACDILSRFAIRKLPAAKTARAYDTNPRLLKMVAFEVIIGGGIYPMPDTWLFAELQMARIVRKKQKDRRVVLNEKIAASKSLRISLPADIDFLSPVDADMLNRWMNVHDQVGGSALHNLYNIVPEG